MNEEKIAARAIAQLESRTGLKLLPTQLNEVLGTGLWADMRVRLEHTQNELVVEIKKGATRADFDALVKRLKMAAGEEPPLLIADHVNQSMATQLKDLKINYLDSVGNAYLNIPPFFVLIQGQAQDSTLRDPKPAKAFSEADLKVVYALLANPDLLNANYGEIADHAGVALGVVGTIVRDLKDQGYFVESGSPRRRSWKQRQKLISRWVEDYPKLREKHFLGAYYTANKNWWQSPEMAKYDAQLGGDFAAVYYSKNAKPSFASIYLDDQQQWQFLRELRFIKAESDLMQNVKVFSKFWGKNGTQESQKNVTHPLITYADLLATGNPRNRTAANEIALRYFGE